ncbi:family 61 endoglucanase [Phellopilus nigrolimitatus]|nr:family 61 endoglucanase [Phellopilus nigrolimitatus]
MRFTAASIVVALSSLALVSAHGNIVTFVIDGVSYPAWQPYGASSQPGTINRPFYANGPATPFESGTAIICNGDNLAANASAPATAGSVVTTNWDWPSVHPGPVMGYLAKCNGPCSEFFGDGPWVKIQQDGYDPTLSTPWAEERLRAAQQWDFTIPKDLEDGEYLLRTEILGLHAASNPGGAQFYPSCAQLVISGGTGGTWPQGIAISGAYQDNDPGILVALYTITPTNPAYTPPGGPVLLT